MQCSCQLQQDAAEVCTGIAVSNKSKKKKKKVVYVLTSHGPAVNERRVFCSNSLDIPSTVLILQ